MNCAEYKELLVAFIEGLLDETQKHSVAEHLKSCASCRAELNEVRNLQGRLVKNGNSLTQSNLEEIVLDRIIREQNVRIKTSTKISTSLKLRRVIMKSPITKFAAAAAIIIAALITFYFVGNPLGATVTFADVIKPILNARTVVFDFIVGSEETGPVMHDIVVGSKIRRTFTNMDPIMIIDLDSAKMLTLDPKSKGAAYVNIEGPLQAGTKHLLEFVRKVITGLKDLPVQELGQRNIDGRKAIGFYAAEKPNIELTIWADPETAKPIRIELLMGQSLYILKNFEFDVPVDETLVSMDVPAGYKLSDKMFDMTQFTEQDFITVLRLWVEHVLGGNFPQSLSAGELMSQTPAIAGKIGQLNISDEEKTQLGMTMGRGLVFFQQLDPTGVTWHYAGRGVKLGDAGKAIFWYQPKNSATYRVIYGDLSVKDVAPTDLPK
ncbi:MAG: zf-HC2 domain-containing protein [Sedimentisphaerales bacterium]|nr:zf-HC2 domain-containing protein [Sedimentisphaerales bacterium]